MFFVEKEEHMQKLFALIFKKLWDMSQLIDIDIVNDNSIFSGLITVNWFFQGKQLLSLSCF